MAHAKENFLLKGIRGNIGKELVFKQYASGTVIGLYPRKSKKKRTELQLLYNNRFKESVKYAKAILANRELKKKYEAKAKKNGRRPYNYAMSEYTELVKAGKLPEKKG